MKRIEAIVPQRYAEETAVELMKAGISGVTMYDSKGRGEVERPEITSRRGTARYRPAFNANATIVVVVKDHLVDKIVDKIVKQSSTGKSGEGKIFVSDVVDVVDVGSQKRGDAAL